MSLLTYLMVNQLDVTTLTVALLVPTLAMPEYNYWEGHWRGEMGAGIFFILGWKNGIWVTGTGTCSL